MNLVLFVSTIDNNLVHYRRPLYCENINIGKNKEQCEQQKQCLKCHNLQNSGN
jgi:hypothetical protein